MPSLAEIGRGGTPWGGSPPIAPYYPDRSSRDWFTSQGAPSPEVADTFARQHPELAGQPGPPGGMTAPGSPAPPDGPGVAGMDFYRNEGRGGMTPPGSPAPPGGPAPVGGPAPGVGDGLPPRPADLASAIAQANQLAYGGRNKHDDPNYWAAMWAKDPEYTWKRLLGWQAGGADAAQAGPYAGGQGGVGGGGGGGSAGMQAALETSPGYQFRLAEGQKALERSAAAKGTLLTGGTAKGLARYAQDFASNEYGQRYNQLMGLAQLGAGAASGQAGVNTAYGGAAGDLLTQRGNAAAAGTVGGANAWQAGLNNATNLAQQYYLARMYGMSPGGSTPGAAPSPYAPNAGLPGYVPTGQVR